MNEPTDEREIRDPRCQDGACDFPSCNCLYPPHTIQLESPGKILSRAILLGMFIALAISFGWFYLINEVL